VKCLKNVNVTFLIHHDDVRLAERDKLRMWDLEFTSVRRSNREWAKTSGQVLPNLLDAHACGRSGSNKLPHRLQPVVHQEMRAPAQVLHRGLVHVDAQSVVERREDFAKLDGPFRSLTA